VSSKTRKKHRLQIQDQQPPKPPLTAAPPPEPPPPIWEKRLEQTAVRERWPMSSERRATIIDRLFEIVEGKSCNSELGIQVFPSTREVTSASKALISADRLNLQAEQHRDQVAAEAATTAATEATEPTDPARFDWYAESCPCGLPAGECKEHPRARESQRPPEEDWSRWFLMAGRGSGKTRSGAEWVRELAESGRAKRIALVAPTAADVRDVMVKGDSGILAISRPDFMPLYQPSIRRLTWPNGTIATCYSADVPDRLRGPQHDFAWIDEPGAWQRGQDAWDMLMFGLRIGDNPQVCITSTPRATKLIKYLANDPKTVISKSSTYDNRAHLAPSFFTEIITRYEGTRLGEQELMAVLLEITEGAWFPGFTITRHVSETAEYHPAFPIRVAIDAGTSRHTGAVFFQMRPQERGWPIFTVFGDYYGLDIVSAENAAGILAKCRELTGGTPHLVRLDPAAVARTSIGPAAYSEYERVFGSRWTARWPMHGVVDGLDQIELMLGSGTAEPRLLIHPRCTHLISAFQNYRRQERDGEYLDSPVDPQHTAEDLMDALRGGVRDAMPEGRTPAPNLRTVHARQMT
jgi:hypothetical protein